MVSALTKLIVSYLKETKLQVNYLISLEQVIFLGYGNQGVYKHFLKLLCPTIREINNMDLGLGRTEIKSQLYHLQPIKQTDSLP